MKGKPRGEPYLTHEFFRTSDEFKLGLADFLRHEKGIFGRSSRHSRLAAATPFTQDSDLLLRYEASDRYERAYRNFKREEERLRQSFALSDYEGFVRESLENAGAWLEDARRIADGGHPGHGISLCLLALEEVGKATIAFLAFKRISPLSDYEWMCRCPITWDLRPRYRFWQRSMRIIEEGTDYSEMLTWFGTLAKVRGLVESGQSLSEIRDTPEAKPRDLLPVLPPSSTEDEFLEDMPLSNAIQDLRERATYVGMVAGDAESIERLSSPKELGQKFPQWLDSMAAIHRAATAFCTDWGPTEDILELVRAILLEAASKALSTRSDDSTESAYD